MKRSDQLKRLRPILQLENPVDISAVEAFQNEVIRPILKFQNELLQAVFLSNPLVLKRKFEQLDTEKKQELIYDTIQHHSPTKNSLIHIVIGLFTIEEFEAYSVNRKAINKRIITMITERLIDQLVHKSNYQGDF